MADAGFRLPGSSYEELANIIMAYGTRDEASNPGDVSKLDSVHRSSVTRTNGFLVEIGVLRGEREKLVTKRGRELALALERRDKSEIRRSWRVIVSTSEFLQNVVSAVKLREEMEYTMTQAYIAHAAGQPRNKPVMIGSSTVVEILKTSGLLKEDEAGNLSATYAEEAPEPADEEFLETPDLAVAPEKTVPDDAPPPNTANEANVSANPTNSTSDAMANAMSNVAPNSLANPALNIHLHVRCEADELEDIAPRLKSLIRELREDLPGSPTVSGEAKESEKGSEEAPNKIIRDDDFGRDFLEENANPPVFEEEFEGGFGRF